MPGEKKPKLLCPAVWSHNISTILKIFLGRNLGESETPGMISYTVKKNVCCIVMKLVLPNSSNLKKPQNHRLDLKWHVIFKEKNHLVFSFLYFTVWFLSSLGFFCRVYLSVCNGVFVLWLGFTHNTTVRGFPKSRHCSVI